jgi:hypothetical protein
MSASPVTEPKKYDGGFSHLPTIGLDILLVGQGRHTQPIAKALLELSNNEFWREENRREQGDAPLPAESMEASIDQLTIEILQRTLMGKKNHLDVLHNRNVHLIESLLDPEGFLKRKLPQDRMDHVVLVAPVSPLLYSANAIEQLYRNKNVLRTLQILDLPETCRQRVSIVAAMIPDGDGEALFNEDTSSSIGQGNTQSQRRRLFANIPIFVCHPDSRISRQIVAHMLWKRTALGSRADPYTAASPLVFRTGKA